jgi:fibronectin type 3 domain-containing protein
MRSLGQLTRRLAPAITLVALAFGASGCSGLTPAFYACLLSGAGDSEACGDESLAPGPPSAPTEVTAILHFGLPAGAPLVPNASVRLRYGAPTPDVDHYHVYRSATSGGPYAKLKDVGGRDSGATFDQYLDIPEDGPGPIAVCSTVYYVVTAVDRLGQESAKSDEVSAPTRCYGRSVPSGLRARPGFSGIHSDPGSVTLDWDDSDDPDLLGYDVYRETRADVLDSRPDGDYVKVNAALVTQSEYVDENAVRGREHFYRVAAVYRGSRTGISGVVSGWVSPSDEVTNDWRVRAVPGANSIRLTWFPPERILGGDKMLVYRGVEEGFYQNGLPPEGSTLVAVLSFFERSYVDTDVVNFTREYFYRLAVGFNNREESARSQIVSATPFAERPAAPVGLTAVALPGSVRLNWVDNGEADVTGYNVYQADEADGPFHLASSTTASEQLVTGLEDDSTYFFRVTARGAGGESEPSSVVSGTPHVPPAAPTGLTAVVAGDVAHLDWNDSPEPNLDGYRVHSATQESGPFFPVFGELVRVSEANVPLVLGTTLFFRVNAVDTSGAESEPSSVVSATPDAGDAAPAAPTGLTATPGENSVLLDWADNLEADLAGYKVWMATAEAGPFGIIGRGLLRSSERLVVDLPAGSPFFLRVTAVDMAGQESPPSAVVSAIPCAGPCLTLLSAATVLTRPAYPAHQPGPRRFPSIMRVSGAYAGGGSSRRNGGEPPAEFRLDVTGSFSGAGRSRLEGGAIVGSGFGFDGSFELRVPPGQLDRELRHLVAGGARGTWRSTVNWRIEPAAHTASSNGIALATFANPQLGRACLRFSESYSGDSPGESSRASGAGVFTLLGGTEAAAHLLGDGSYRVSVRPDGTLVYHGKARASRRAGDELPAECEALQAAAARRGR